MHLKFLGLGICKLHPGVVLGHAEVQPICQGSVSGVMPLPPLGIEWRTSVLQWLHPTLVSRPFAGVVQGEGVNVRSWNWKVHCWGALCFGTSPLWEKLKEVILREEKDQRLKDPKDWIFQNGQLIAKLYLLFVASIYQLITCFVQKYTHFSN